MNFTMENEFRTFLCEQQLHHLFCVCKQLLPPLVDSRIMSLGRLLVMFTEFESIVFSTLDFLLRYGY